VFVSGKDHVSSQARLAVTARLLAGAAIALTVFAQFSSSWHEITARHVRCAEHGELTHVATGDGRAPSPAGRDNLIAASDPQTPSEHEHCGFVLTAQGSLQPSVVRAAVKLPPPPTGTPRPNEPAPRPRRVVVLASAPKTSPPSV
jgi:hypothetical protein